MFQSVEHIKGWLKFFYIVFYIRVFSSVISIILSAYAYSSQNPKLLELFTPINIIDETLSIMLMVKAINHIKSPNSASYKRLIWLSSFMAILSFLTPAINSIFFEGFEFAYPTHVIIPLGLIIYLQQSSHAKSVFPRDISTQQHYPSAKESKEMASGMLKMAAVSFTVISIPFILFWFVAG